MDLNFETSERQVGDATVVTVLGELDVATAPALQEHLRSSVDAGATTVVVDLLEVPFLDSTALGVLVDAAKTLREHDGSLRIALKEPRLKRLFEITGLTGTLPIYADVEAAARR